MPESASFEESLEWANNYRPAEESQTEYGILVCAILVYLVIAGACLFLIKDKHDARVEEDSEEEEESTEDYYSGEEGSDDCESEQAQEMMRPGSITRIVRTQPLAINDMRR